MFARKALLVACCLLLVVFVKRSEAGRPPKSIKPKIRFIATSWFIRGTWGRNEDKYLVELALSSKESPFFAYLIDNYQPESSPISQEALRSQTGTEFRVLRNTGCDIPFGQIALRTAPADLMAVLPGRLGYRPPLERLPNPATNIPCYRVLRR